MILLSLQPIYKLKNLYAYGWNIDILWLGDSYISDYLFC